jgi:quercetin dioxygenase-like cupin family protein
MPTSPLISATDAPTFALSGIEFTGFAAPSRGAIDSAVWTVAIQPRTPGVLHQMTREEVFIALEGRARVSVGGVDYELEAGGALIVPADTDFALTNPYDATFRAVAVSPVGSQARLNGDVFVPPWAS